VLSPGRKFLFSAAISTLASTMVLCGAAGTAFADPAADLQAANAAAAQAGDPVAKAKAELARLDAESSAGEENYAQAKRLRKQASEIARANFQNRGVDTTAALFVSGDPESFLQQISTAQNVDENMNSVLQQFQSEQANLTDLKRAADSETEKAAAAERQMADLLVTEKAKVAQASAVLAGLSSAQQATLAQAQLTQANAAAATQALGAISVSGTGSAAGVAAASFAKAQVGHAYVWGAAGPSAFDCSGLVMAAYQTVGISLPHSARAQSQMGTAVSVSDLQPGDLLFWYGGPSHVSMYIGGGMMVHALNSNSGVVIGSVSAFMSQGLTGARRIVG
jgi:cell wall-associated NlpC family hydrolase